MSTLRYSGATLRCGLREGMYVTVPTNWATSFFVPGYVTKSAIPEIVEALEEKGIEIDDYDYVFRLVDDSRIKTRRGNSVMLFWKEV